jgi:hypothetical protein
VLRDHRGALLAAVAQQIAAPGRAGPPRCGHECGVAIRWQRAGLRPTSWATASVSSPARPRNKITSA